MARTTLKGAPVDGERRLWALSERIVDEHLGGYRRVRQSRESPRMMARGEIHDLRAAGNAREPARKDCDDAEQERMDVAWLYTWSQVG
ncbi:MAG: hypothetical protein ACLP0J_07645 [Solirubrobacteraceae bacterium]|jgi:hypothetical protein